MKGNVSRSGRISGEWSGVNGAFKLCGSGKDGEKSFATHRSLSSISIYRNGPKNWSRSQMTTLLQR